MIRLAAIMLLAGCGATIEMPAPVAYPGACPEDNWRCQRNADAQTLKYIGEGGAAMRLMCQDADLAAVIGDGCDILPVVY